MDFTPTPSRSGAFEIAPTMCENNTRRIASDSVTLFDKKRQGSRKACPALDLIPSVLISSLSKKRIG